MLVSFTKHLILTVWTMLLDNVENDTMMALFIDISIFNTTFRCMLVQFESHFKDCASMRRSRKFCQSGSNFDNVFVVVF